MNIYIILILQLYLAIGFSLTLQHVYIYYHKDGREYLNAVEEKDDNDIDIFFTIPKIGVLLVCLFVNSLWGLAFIWTLFIYVFKHAEYKEFKKKRKVVKSIEKFRKLEENSEKIQKIFLIIELLVLIGIKFLI